MDSVDLEVLSAAIGWLQAGQRVTLVTVAQTWGSAPRPPGAWLALRADGRVVGSVSGGCIEADLIQRLQNGQLDAASPYLLSYGVTKEEAARFGLPCGGKLQLVVEPQPQAALLQTLAAHIQRGERIAKTLDIQTGQTALASASASADSRHHFDGTSLITLHGPRYRLLLIGAVQIARYLAEMAQALDYQVSVCDPRSEYTDAWNVAGTTLSRAMPDDAVTAMNADPHSAIVALTHDPKLDDMALLEALKSPAFYVGALGSRKNNAKRRERLRLFDLGAAEIDRLHGPVGLPIGSHTPPEIAVAILAEMTAVRHGVSLQIAAPSDAASALQQPCLKGLSAPSLN